MNIRKSERMVTRFDGMKHFYQGLVFTSVNEFAVSAAFQGSLSDNQIPSLSLVITMKDGSFHTIKVEDVNEKGVPNNENWDIELLQKADEYIDSLLNG
jgi:hypothetical protein